MKKNRTPQKKLLFFTLIGYALSIAILLGGRLGFAAAYQNGAVQWEDYIFFGALVTNILFLIGLFRPEKWKRILALSVLLRTLLWWHWYGVKSDNLIYGIFSFPINAITEALLISFLLSTKRGNLLKGITIAFLWVRAVPAMAFQPEGEPVYVLLMISAVQIRSVALTCLVSALGAKIKAGKLQPTLNEGFLAEAGREKTAYICIHCGRDNSCSRGICTHCGEELKEDVSLFENMPEEGEEQPYLDLLFQELDCEKLSDLLQRPERLELRPNWQRAVENAQGEMKLRLRKIRRLIFNRYEQQHMDDLYGKAMMLQQGGNAEDSIESAKAFARLGSYQDASKQAETSLQQAQEQVYAQAQEQESQENWEAARKLYERIPQWKDAAKKALHCKKMWDRSLSPFYGYGWLVRVLLFALCLLSGLGAFLLVS